MICLWGITENVGFSNISTISVIAETVAPAPEVSPNSWKLLEILVKATFSVGVPEICD